MDTYTHYIIDNGVRIGFYNSETDAKEAMTYCNKGYITARHNWEKTQCNEQ